MSEPENELLAETYRGFSDEYLRERITSGALTETAVSIAQQELVNRGLEAPQPPPPPEDETIFDAPAQEFITVARFNNLLSAQILRARLEAEGIQAVVGDVEVARVLFPTLVGGSKVRVPRSQVAAANEIIAAIRSGALAADDTRD